MLITIRPELHERWPGDKIPASDYQLEASELAKLGAFKEWRDTNGRLRRLPPATYISETTTVQNCRSALAQIASRTGRSVSGIMHEGQGIYFHNLAEIEPATAMQTSSSISPLGIAPARRSLYASLIGEKRKSNPTSPDFASLLGKRIRLG